MNVGNIKAFIDQKPSNTPLGEVNKQLKQQAMQQMQTVAAGSPSPVALSSQFQIGVNVFNNALNGTLNINQRQADLPEPKDNQSLFNFEEVAKNVLKFVGGVLKNAHANGANKETLQDLFQQAREGVQKGIKMAEKDLGGLMNDEIKQGIDSSNQLIEDGIKRLESQLIGEPSQKFALVTESTRYARSESGELLIRTKDGDELTLKFEDLAAFEANKNLLLKQNSDQKDEKSQDSSASKSQQYQLYQYQSLSFSLKGQLDEEELKAIGDLVKDTNNLADTFFKGDVDAAFNQALNMGFDDQELTGFALQLTRQEQVQVINTYESVSHYDENKPSERDPAKAVQPVASYLQQMLAVMEKAQEKLQDGQSYEKLVNSLINEMKEVHTPDLISAINRFHSFNSQLLNALPQQEISESEQNTEQSSKQKT